jgi:STE24 endopeptidase
MLHRCLTTLALVFFLLPRAFSQPIPIPPAAQASPNFNVDAATEAYLALIPPDKRARSDAYFEGGYWLQLWDFLIASAIAILLLQLRWSARMRDVAERITRFKPLQSFLYWVQYAIITSLIAFPMTVYEAYGREHKYGLATQTFGPWLYDQFKGLLIAIVLGGIFVMLLFGIVRRAPRHWWIPGAVATELFLIFVVLITPVYLVPVFNKVTPLNDAKVTQPLLSLARANGIPAHEIYEVDASKQTTRISANVSGFAGTMRITLNDNLLNRASLEEIEAVTAHEMGHYVLNHIYKLILFAIIVIAIAFAFLRWSIEWCIERWGENWGIRGIGDPAIIPLVLLLLGILSFIGTPFLNTFTRAQEHEADMYGINASRQPDGFAQAAIQLAEYRKMRPGPVEEWIFYDHPSGYRRIHDSMRWKAENLNIVKQ